MEDRIRVLWIGDGYVPTGFARVNQSIIDNLGDEYDIHHLAVNYSGDPHPHRQQMYPASARDPRDLWGFTRLQDFVDKGIDLIFILNDVWVIDNYLHYIKETFKDKIPPIVVYYPVDSQNYDEDYFKHFDIVDVPVCYTNFGLNVSMAANPRDDYKVIPHGVNTDIFYPITEYSKADVKRMVFDNEEAGEHFIVLNANRNQPRKRIDIAVAGFALFAKDKPDTVRYYHHAGIIDAGWDIIKLFKRYNMEHRLILTSMSPKVQAVPDSKLNIIYNTGDIGINTSTGEGWGLTSTEHAATRAAQIVGNHTAPAELFQDCGLLLEPAIEVQSVPQLTTHYMTTPQEVANKLEMLYQDENLRNDLADKAYKKFTGEEYQWKNIAKQWDELFKSVL